MAVSRFTNGTPLNFELIAAEVSGELPYTVGYERSSVSFNGGPLQPNTLRPPTSTAESTATGNSFTATATTPDQSEPARRGVDAIGVTGSQINSRSIIFTSTQHPRSGRGCLKRLMTWSDAL
jgi:hypothetical protein